MQENCPDGARWYRHASKGAFPFSTRDHGWPISDCTAEGLKAAQRLVAAQGAGIDDLVEAMPFIEPYLNASLGVVCHSTAARDQIRQRSSAPVLTLPLPYGAEAAAALPPREVSSTS